MEKKIIKAVQEEVENYIAINGETGSWGEPMNDSIAVDIIYENLLNNENLEKELEYFKNSDFVEKTIERIINEEYSK